MKLLENKMAKKGRKQKIGDNLLSVLFCLQPETLPRRGARMLLDSIVRTGPVGTVEKRHEVSQIKRVRITNESQRMKKVVDLYIKKIENKYGFILNKSVNKK